MKEKKGVVQMSEKQKRRVSRYIEFFKPMRQNKKIPKFIRSTLYWWVFDTFVDRY